MAEAPEHEQQRLAAVYAAMEDGELLQLLADVDALTDPAWEALQAELARRDLLPENVPVPARDVIEGRPLVTAAYFGNLLDAQLAKGVLESAGIECFLQNENVVRIYLANVVGGIALQVDPENVAAAKEILEHPLADAVVDAGDQDSDP